MKKVRIILIFAWLYAVSSNARGNSSYVFHRLSTNDGLSNNSVKAILKDSHGFLWIGTEFGLNRYDGYGFKTFFYKPNNSNAIPSNSISGLWEDGLKNIWIDFGYSYAVYDRENDNFITDVNVVLAKFDIKINGDRKIYIDKKKNLFVLTVDKIYIYNTISKQLNTYPLPKLNLSNVTLGDDLNYLYIVDSRSYCWQMDKNSGSIVKISLPSAADVNYENMSTKIFADSNGGLWLFSGKDEYVYFRPSMSAQWQKIYLKSSITSQNSVTSIVEGNDGRIWIATDHRGLFCYDKPTGILTNIISNLNSQTSIATNNVTCVLIDNGGVVWAGHDKKGISYYHESFQNFLNVQFDQCRDVSRILELRNGNILLGTDGYGLFSRNSAKNEITKLPIPNAAVTALLEDKKGRVWVGTFQLGLFCIEGSKISHFTLQNSNLSSDNIWSLVEDKFGSIWIGTLGGKIHKYGVNAKANYFETPFKTTRHVSDMFYDGNKTIYVGTVYGLDIIDVERNTEQLLLGNKKNSQKFNVLQIFNVFKDSRNLLWLGTNAGLAIWDIQKDTLTYFSSADGLNDNIVRGIVEDNLHNIWVTTSNGLSVIMMDKNNRNIIANCRNFSSSDGLKNDYFNNNAICKLRNGAILTGINEGYTVVDPQSVMARSEPLSKIYLTKLLVGNAVVDVDSAYNGHVILDKSIEQIPALNLKYNDKLVTLEFTTVDLLNARKVKYRYKIEGFNNQWITTKKNEVIITSLPAGTYRLLLKSCNSDGVWSEDVKALIINVAPPFYYSHWAITLYVFLVICIVLFFIYKAQKRSQRKLEEQRRQMSHEHDLQINDMKLRFFTNISHDLRTPLTLIITPLQTILKELPDDDLKKKIQIISKNAQQLMTMINSLLDFRKLDVGAEVVHLNPENIVDLVDEIYESFNVYAKERNITFILNKSFDKLWIEYDSDKIQKAIVNVLSNAFKYTPDKGTVGLSLYKQDLNVCINISDTGIGISDEDKGQVFNRFFQTSHNHKYTGSGIGLHIASEYVKLHRGTISIADNCPTGSVFTIKFPMVFAEELAKNGPFAAEQTDVPETFTENTTLLSKQVLLFVEDNQDLCDFISSSLSDEYTVLIANNGREAIVLLNQYDVNIIVSDIMMPVMDGIELCKQVKSNINWSHIPVILLTARTTDEHKIEGLELGADDYITKPFNLDILKLRIVKFAEWSIRNHQTFKQKMDVKPGEITITTLDEKLIERAISVVEEHMSNTEFSVEMLGDALGLSRGHLYKKLMAITGKGPAEFIRTIRLKRGRQLLEKSQMQIAEIAYEVGYNSPKRFTINFREEFGVVPSEYIRNLKGEQ